jgi:hypothetical protein
MAVSIRWARIPREERFELNLGLTFATVSLQLREGIISVSYHFVAHYFNVPKGPGTMSI